MNLSDIGPVVLVGAGKMGLALARGWIAGGLPPERLVLCDTQPSVAAVEFAEHHGIRLLLSPVGVLTHVLVIAVKPQVIYEVMAEIQPVVGSYTLVLSIAAGVSLVALSEGLMTERVIRTMPNTPAQIGRGITGAVGLGITDEDRATANALLSAAGEVMWFDDETRIDAVTAVSGSGPAYVFYMVEALAAAARKQGFDEEQAMQLARATVTGAAALMDADPTPASTLRENVTSPKGTTAAALNVLMAPDGLEPLMDRAVAAARRRSEELGRA
ncbi:MAG: Pyrroline-5-carboxylate reductase [Devosia sp.]|uniref:pyrroline-5-carboxylate reductase n=1 Tax=Devosia sp. TaxID=1871048 RepID=UPI0026398F00|nr:pyrroline-5-carboxylate reductase [Devosia sp.]MDB5538770.1 Pyrroline-5-carboxylate reductase [Devosia sp.]